jgi:hypothetical protein
VPGLAPHELLLLFLARQSPVASLWVLALQLPCFGRWIPACILILILQRRL